MPPPPASLFAQRHTSFSRSHGSSKCILCLLLPRLPPSTSRQCDDMSSPLTLLSAGESPGRPIGCDSEGAITALRLTRQGLTATIRRWRSHATVSYAKTFNCRAGREEGEGERRREAEPTGRLTGRAWGQRQQWPYYSLPSRDRASPPGRPVSPLCAQSSGL
jgi:hypothetical protein